MDYKKGRKIEVIISKNADLHGGSRMFFSFCSTPNCCFTCCDLNDDVIDVYSYYDDTFKDLMKHAKPVICDDCGIEMCPASIE